MEEIDIYALRGAILNLKMVEESLGKMAGAAQTLHLDDLCKDLLYLRQEIRHVRLFLSQKED
jgi:hypothetical protein